MSITRIENIDVRDGQVYLAILNPDGSTLIQRKPFRYFLLSSQMTDSDWLKLSGDNHYQWIKFYDTKHAFWDDYRVQSVSVGKPYAVFNDIEAARVLTGVKLFEGLTHKDLCTLSFDLETNGLKMGPDSMVLLISNTVRKNGIIQRKLFAYDEFPNQAAMLQAWAAWVSEMDPGLMVAFNGLSFDIPFLMHVARLHGVKLALGRDGSELEMDRWVSEFRRDGSQSISYRDARIFLRSFIDVIFLAIKSDQAERKFESYGLKSIMKTLDLEREGRHHYDASQIQKSYRDPVEWAKIKAYAIDDADDGLTLLDRFLPPYFALAKLIPKSLQATVNGSGGSQINSFMIASYIGRFHSIPQPSPVIQFEGGKTIATPGLHRWAVRFDVASLYPSCMLHWNIHDPKKDPHGCFIRMLSEWTASRLKFKAIYKETGDLEAKAMSDSVKIAINSAYGMLAAPGLAFNSPENAAEVTRHGREILTQAMQWAEGRGFTVIFGDTDSLAFTKGEPADADERRALLAELNSIFPSLIRFEEDGYYDRYLIVSRKNYITQQDGKITIKGASLKGSSREPALRECLQRIGIALLNDQADQVESLLAEYESEIENLQDITRWAAKRTVTKAVLSPGRTNEQKVLEALSSCDFQEGDKIYVYFTETGALKVASQWNGDHCKKRLKEKLKKTLKIIEGIIPC